MSHPNIAHWDDVEEHEHEEGSIHSAWRYLGEAAGTVGVGVNRIRIHPGCRSTPLHSHGDHEEIFFVLGGSGLSWQRIERGEDVVCEVGPGTCLVHLATGPAHTLVAGPDGLDVLAYGNGRRGGRQLRLVPAHREGRDGPVALRRRPDAPVGARGRAARAGAAGARERPPNVVRLEDVEPEVLDRGEFGDSSREPGFTERYERLLTAGGSTSPEEKLAVVGVDLGDPEIWNDGFAVLKGFVERMC